MFQVQDIPMKHSQYYIYQHKPTYGRSDAPKVIPIAPASDRKQLSVDVQMEINKKYTNRSNPYIGAQAASIAKRNARERNRVKQVNDGFNALRKRLPGSVIAALSGGARRGSGTKLSKVDTLRMVVEYIRYLEGLIDESDETEFSGKFQNSMKEMTSSLDIDEGVYAERLSPYTESLSSPANSDSSGISSGFSNGGHLVHRFQSNQASSLEDEVLLDAITWWQHK